MEGESKTLCCGGGKKVLPDDHIQMIPDDLLNLYHDQRFRRHARSYNALFAMTSVGVKEGGRWVNEGIHPATLSLHGSLYHCLMPTHTEKCPLTWLIFDTKERQEVAFQRNLDVDFVNRVREVLHNYHPWVRVCRSFGESGVARSGSLVLKFPPHGGVDEVAAIYDIAGRTSHTGRDITFFFRDSHIPRYIKASHPAYMSLAYPLLYPHGESGWHPEFKDPWSGEKFTMNEYYNQLHLRHPIFRFSGRLFHQHILDAWISIEDERLDVIARKVNLRIATRQTICESIYAEGGPRPGKLYLPSSFVNSPRESAKLIDEGMAVVAARGPPTFFITITCNPDWPEIRDALAPGTGPCDDPYVTNRVFKARLRKVITFIKNKFGPLDYIMYVIEFQKRGLPHAHMTLRCSTPPVDIDSVICAMRPRTPGELQRLVDRFMTHSCSTTRGCLDEIGGKCKKFFPKQLTPQTLITENGFPAYKRLSNDDRYIVPYNEELLLYAKTHINVELCANTRSISYLYKYLYKPPETTSYVIIDTAETNEIENYKRGRYVSANEAAWRLLGFHTHHREPAVKTISVHLPGRELIAFTPGLEQRATETYLSELDRYYNRPSGEPWDSLTLLQYYEDWTVSSTPPKQGTPYVMDTASHPYKKYYVWAKLHRSKKTVTRLANLLPTTGEVFYLRLLLRNYATRNPYNFFGVVNDAERLEPETFVQVRTFQDAAIALGLVTSVEESMLAFEESLARQRGAKSLRSLFVMMLVHGFAMTAVFDKHSEAMAEDYIYRGMSLPLAHNELLRDLNNRLSSLGKTLLDFGFPMPTESDSEADRARLAYPPAQERTKYEELYITCTNEQKSIVDRVLLSVQQSTAFVMMIQAPAGYGKSHIFKTIAHGTRASAHIVAVTATTGLAALNYEGGRTLHSVMRMSVVDDPILDSIECDVGGTSERAEYLRQVAVFLIDEVTMAHVQWLVAMDTCLQGLMANTLPFGGKVVVFAGDFRQLPPVVKDGSEEDIFKASLPSFYYWPYMVRKTLSIPMRDSQDLQWSTMVKGIGDDTHIRDETNRITLPLMSHTSSETEAVDFVFPNEILSQPQVAATRAILCGTNDLVDQQNAAIYNRLQGDERVYLSYDKNAAADPQSMYNPLAASDILNQIQYPGTPPHRLHLKVGAVCFIMRNLSFEDGLMNNTKVVITALYNRTVEVLILAGPAKGQIRSIPRITFKQTWHRTGIILERHQFPLRLAYAMTFNKSQGQTLDRIVLDLRHPIFAHGQLYVGCSRVRDRTCCLGLVRDTDVINGVVRCLNIVNRHIKAVLVSLCT